MPAETIQHKKLFRVKYSRKDLASMYGYKDYRVIFSEVHRNSLLLSELQALGYTENDKKHLTRNMVILIFKAIGSPEGYETYENV